MTRRKLTPHEYSKLTDTERCLLNGRLVAARWKRQARPEQIPGFGFEQSWITHLFQAGRGSGKTHSAAVWLLVWALTRPGSNLGILTPTFDHAMKVCIFGAGSGIMSILPDQSIARWNDMKKQLVFSNGSVITCYSSEHIRQMRGPQFHAVWIDEPSDLSHGMTCWEVARPAVRLKSKDGTPARLFITGTPRPVPLILHMHELHEKHPDKYTISQGRTKDNLSNLDEHMVEELYARYEGSRYFLQEIEGVLLTQAEGALWRNEVIHACRTEYYPDQMEFEEIAIGVDPAVSERKDADETGIVVAGRFGDSAAVIGDYSMRSSPLEWARLLGTLVERHGARTIVYERNLAGPLIKDVMQSALNEWNLPVKLVAVTAKTKKHERAEPVAAMYEAGKVVHLKQRTGTGTLERLEAQMTTWEPTESKSPDRIDALVHVIDYLLLRNRRTHVFRAGAQPTGLAPRGRSRY